MDRQQTPTSAHLCVAVCPPPLQDFRQKYTMSKVLGRFVHRLTTHCSLCVYKECEWVHLYKFVCNVFCVVFVVQRCLWGSEACLREGNLFQVCSKSDQQKDLLCWSMSHAHHTQTHTHFFMSSAVLHLMCIQRSHTLVRASWTR